MRLVRAERKTPVLKAPAFGCFRDIPAINITRGCPHRCVYCYARGFPSAPPPGEVHLYTNLPAKLEEELARRKKWPRWVSFSTASDPFPPVEAVLEVTYRTMTLLLVRGIGVTFLTKGFIPPDFLALFHRYSRLVRARIGLVSLSEAYWRTFEPGAAHPAKRLANIRNLSAAGIPVEVRLDPLIPEVTDRAAAVEHLLKRIRAAGARAITVSALVLRPTVAARLAAELPAGLARQIFAAYRDQPWQRVITAATTKLLPREVRVACYQMVKELASRYGLECRVCGCKNPDLPWESCIPNLAGDRCAARKAEQRSLFELVPFPE